MSDFECNLKVNNKIETLAITIESIGEYGKQKSHRQNEICESQNTKKRRINYFEFKYLEKQIQENAHTQTLKL